MDEFIVIFCTVSPKEEAKNIAKAIIEKKLAACANIIEGITSIYEWEGEICTEEECLMIIKTKKKIFSRIKEEIVSLHPYEVPEIISLPITEGLESYLSWVDKNTNPGKEA